MSVIILAFFLTSAFPSLVWTAFELSYGDDADLTRFITRPEIKGPRLDVLQCLPEQIASGYIFVAPYAEFSQEKAAMGYYEPCQTGPHMYDTLGNLVWSGASLLRNKNTANFRPIYLNGSYHLSAVLCDDLYDTYDGSGTKGFSYVSNHSYHEVATIYAPKYMSYFNMLEFRVTDRGHTALIILNKPEYRDISALSSLTQHENQTFTAGWVDTQGFREVDLATGAVLFEWWALDHVDIVDSMSAVESIKGPPPSAWNFFYLNSIDKNRAGDYLVSAKNMNAVYCVSGLNGSIIWQLGGTLSSFQSQELNFISQHDARFIETDSSLFARSEGMDYISLFNNNIDEGNDRPKILTEHHSNPISSTLIVEIDKAQKTVRSLLQNRRPDGEATMFGGNSHLLGNGNLFTSWSGNGYMSEYDHQNRLVMEARFASDRFVTYRAYKSDFRAKPTEKPMGRCFAFGVSARNATTICYVSQNGATEVRSWRFSEVRTNEDRVWSVTSKTGFETRAMFLGYALEINVAALNDKGVVLDTSEVIRTEIIQDWIEADDDDRCSNDHDEL